MGDSAWLGLGIWRDQRPARLLSVGVLAMAMTWLGCGNEVADSSAGGGSPFGSSSTSPDGCPTTAPDWNDSGKLACTKEFLTCSYGEECCCGGCSASYTCSCSGGVWVCGFTDACADITCGAEPMDVQLDESATDFWIDCMPEVSADPIEGSFTAIYDNSFGPTSMTHVDSATLQLTVNGESLVWTFGVLPAGTSVPAGEVQQVEHIKTDGWGEGSGQPCDYCGGSWTLDVTWSVEPWNVVSQQIGPVPILCAY